MCDVFPDELQNIPGVGIFKHPEILSDVNNSRVIKVGVYI